LLRLRQAALPAEIEATRTLFKEYGASLGFSLCFQSFDQELASLPGDYAPPRGRLLIAHWFEGNDNHLAGCIALHPLDDATCEMKRLYVRPAFRGKRIGQKLAEAVVEEARKIGYRHMRLDTVPSVMSTAVDLYRDMGFREIPAYRVNPIPGAIYMELAL
jgi:ribosomal protein S18 acetylase RimI-like enzyme